MAWKPNTFKMRYLPGDSCNIEKLCDELRDAGLVVVYGSNDSIYAYIPSFSAHQHINPREAKSQLPAPDVDASSTRAPRVSDETVTGREEGKGKEGKDTFAPPSGVAEDVWRDYLKIRRAKKSPMTEIALKGLQREADRSGMTLEQALIVCVEKSWVGFNADWVSSDKQQYQKGSNGVIKGAL